MSCYATLFLNVLALSHACGVDLIIRFRPSVAFRNDLTSRPGFAAGVQRLLCPTCVKLQIKRILNKIESTDYMN
jgi:hypothetical protein